MGISSMWRRVAVVLVALSLLSVSAMAGDFRQATWGMSKAEVVKAEGDDAKLDDTTQTGTSVLGYERKLQIKDTSHSVFVYYESVDDALFRGLYKIMTPHSNKSAYLNDFVALKTALDEKYSKVNIVPEWKNDLYKDDMEQWGMAISVGHLVLTSTWETETTQIVLALQGDNHKINFTLDYQTVDETLLDQVRAKKKASQESAL